MLKDAQRHLCLHSVKNQIAAKIPAIPVIASDADKTSIKQRV